MAALGCRLLCYTLWILCSVQGCALWRQETGYHCGCIRILFFIYRFNKMMISATSDGVCFSVSQSDSVIHWESWLECISTISTPAEINGILSLRLIVPKHLLQFRRLSVSLRMAVCFSVFVAFSFCVPFSACSVYLSICLPALSVWLLYLSVCLSVCFLSMSVVMLWRCFLVDSSLVPHRKPVSRLKHYSSK